MLKDIRLLCFIVGIVLIFYSLFSLWKRNDPSRLQFNAENLISETMPQNGEKIATGIVIESIGVSLPVIPARKNGNLWETTPNGVSHLVSSPTPGEAGNSIMYGHNWGSILKNLYKAKKGDKIVIYFSDGSKSEFEINALVEVSPDEASLLAPTARPILTLYTCSGLFDQKRLVATASLI